MTVTRSPLTTEMKGPGFVLFQFSAAFPLSQTVLWTGLDAAATLEGSGPV